MAYPKINPNESMILPPSRIIICSYGKATRFEIKLGSNLKTIRSDHGKVWEKAPNDLWYSNRARRSSQLSQFFPCFLYSLLFLTCIVSFPAVLVYFCWVNHFEFFKSLRVLSLLMSHSYFHVIGMNQCSIVVVFSVLNNSIGFSNALFVRSHKDN